MRRYLVLEPTPVDWARTLLVAELDARGSMLHAHGGAYSPPHLVARRMALQGLQVQGRLPTHQTIETALDYLVERGLVSPMLDEHEADRGRPQGYRWSRYATEVAMRALATRLGAVSMVCEWCKGPLRSSSTGQRKRFCCPPHARLARDARARGARVS